MIANRGWTSSLAFAGLLVACTGGGTPGSTARSTSPETASAPKLSPEASVDRAVELAVGIGRVVMAAGSDCDGMSTKVKAWLDSHGFELKRVNAGLAKIDSAELKQRYRNGLAENLDVVMGLEAGVAGCLAHPGFSAEWRRLGQ